MQRSDLLGYLKKAVATVPEVRGYLSKDVLLMLEDKPSVKATISGDDLSTINAQYHDAITSILTGYFEGGGSISAPRNEFRRTANDALGAAFDGGWQDGGQAMPPDEDALAWLNARIEQEFGNIASLFEQAKQLRKEEEFDFFSWATARADGYTNTLGELYNAGVMWAQKNKMLTWNLGQTEVHCDTCQSLDGKSHRASWYISRDYIPRKPGAAMDCRGYRCDCKLTDKEGNEVTV